MTKTTDNASTDATENKLAQFAVTSEMLGDETASYQGVVRTSDQIAANLKAVTTAAFFVASSDYEASLAAGALGTDNDPKKHINRIRETFSNKNDKTNIGHILNAIEGGATAMVVEFAGADAFRQYKAMSADFYKTHGIKAPGTAQNDWRGKLGQRFTMENKGKAKGGAIFVDVGSQIGIDPIALTAFVKAKLPTVKKAEKLADDAAEQAEAERQEATDTPEKCAKMLDALVKKLTAQKEYFAKHGDVDWAMLEKWHADTRAGIGIVDPVKSDDAE